MIALRVPRSTITAPGWISHKRNMFGRKGKKHGLYYLLPGMTRANRQKRKVLFWYSVVIGILVSAAAAAIIYFANLGPQP